MASEVCARKGLFIRLNLRPLRRSAGMDEGSFTHIATAEFCRSYSERIDHLSNRSPDSHDRRANDATIRSANGLINEAGKHASAFDDNTIIAEEVHRRRAIGMACAHRLWSKFKESLDSGALTVVGVEEPCVSTFDVGVDIRVRTQFDVIVQDTQGFVWPLNWKTEGSDIQSAVLGYRHSIQGFLDVQNLRVSSLTANHKGVPGALWAVIQKPGIRRKAVGRPTEEPMSTFIKRCGNWWDGTGEYAPKAGKSAKQPTCLLHRETIPMKGARPGEFLRRLRRYAELLSAPPVLRNFPVVEGACRLGPFTCPYRSLCVTDPVRWPGICREKYTQAPDPLDSDPTRTVAPPPM